MKSLFRYTSLFLVLGALGSCHSDSTSPTQPTLNPPPTGPPAMGPTPTPAPSLHTVNIGQGGNIFVDAQSGTSTTTVRAGQMVSWTWVSGPHSTTSGVCCGPDGKWDSGIRSGGTFSQSFPSAGTFPYYCTVHGSMMTGRVVVNP
jgi:plastocyanin